MSRAVHGEVRPPSATAAGSSHVCLSVRCALGVKEGDRSVWADVCVLRGDPGGPSEGEGTTSLRLAVAHLVLLVAVTVTK